VPKQQWYEQMAPTEHLHRNALRDIVRHVLTRSEFKGFMARLVQDSPAGAQAVIEPGAIKKVSQKFSKLPGVGGSFFQGLEPEHKTGFEHEFGRILNAYDPLSIKPTRTVDFKNDQIRIRIEPMHFRR